ncbi:MAG TPA: hypothetical protein VGK14_03085 [Novimethylophilus sp.]|jgi:hypothetical protein|uniref:hypothetical protein n=1 Tax=Novimethylophilus sp. TaxID=2137426 RepID=UPI002F401203
MAHLRHAREKVAAALATISDIQQFDFPYDDAKEAIAVVKDKFTGLQDTLGLLSDNSNPDTVRTVCRRVTEALFQYLPILGFLIRATDVRGPLEFHRPFLRITRKLLGSDARLIISSDWDFSPYTIIFPDLFGGYRFVMVALPTSEACNALITPLAAHELGHNVWAKEGLREEFERAALEKLIAKIQGPRWDEFKKTFNLANPDQLTDLVGTQLWENAWVWAVAQCEEIFCDFIGVVLFRESYLLAFDYLIAPGLPGDRPERYPSMKNRIEAMSSAAKKLGIDVPTDFEERFDEEDGEAEPQKALLLSLSDEISNMLLDELLVVAIDKIKCAGIEACDKAAVDKIVDAYKKMVPASGTTGIDAVVNAAWKFKNTHSHYWASYHPRMKNNEANRLRLLNDLVLKSFEIFEIERLQEYNGQ